MRFLIVSPEIEDTNYRGVQFVTKHVIRALSLLGHEVILLTSHPKVKIDVKSSRLNDRVLNTYFRQYLANGSALNARMLPRRNKVLSFFSSNFIERLITRYMHKFNVAEIFTGEKFEQAGVIRSSLSFIVSLVSRLRVIKVDTEQASDVKVLRYINEAVNLPYFYRLVNSIPRFLRKWAIEKVARRVKADVVFYSFPLVIPRIKSAKTIQIIYDLIPFEIEEEPVENEWLPRLAKRIDYVTRNSDQVWTISKDSRDRILEIEPKANIKLIGAAISVFEDELELYKQDSPIMTRLNLRNMPFLMFISSVEKRKNVHRLLQAFVSIANDTSASLVIVGNKTEAFREIYRELDGVPKSIKERVIFTGYATEHDKYTLLKYARALVNPTLYEGFGLPVLEAFACGCPVVATTTGALAEISDNATLKIANPYSVSDISVALKEILRNSPLRSLLVKKGTEQAKKYTEEIMYQKIGEALEEL